MTSYTGNPDPAAAPGASEGNRELRRQRSLIKTGALQDAIFNSANFSSIATDERGVIQIFNVGAERMLGYEARDVVNKITPADISDPPELIARATALSLELDAEITPGFEALVFKASRGIEDIYELTYIRKDGSRLPAIVSVTALRDADGQIIGYLLIGTDNTARKQVEAAQAVLDQRLQDQRKQFEYALQEKNLELEHASRMKSEFLATMSHELRTPLNAIVGFSEALRDGLMGPMSSSQNEYIGDIFSSGQHLLSLINDILDLSKVEAGMMSLELESVDLNSLLASSLSIVREKAANQNIQLELQAGEALGLLPLDMRKTKQIVYNLLSNAVKFSAAGGKVTLAARRVARSEVGVVAGDWPVHGFTLADSDYTEFLELSVSDGGIGISQEDMARLFQAFSQIDSSLARKFEGTGLGLAMVKQLAELHGGSLAVSSRENQGARFVVWLPLRPAMDAPGQAPEPTWPALSIAALVDRVALVVEDDERAAELVRLLLEAEGFTVHLAGSAEAALEMARREPPQLITLDLQLPGMNGLQLLERLLLDEVLSKVPVVIISGMDDGSISLGGGAAAVLQKPISRVQLRSSLASLGLLPAPGQTRRLLVVDDDPKAVDVIAAFLPGPDYTVVRAYGGAEAIELAERLLPDLVLVDLMMPGISGFDVVRSLQDNAATAAIPILVVTAKSVSGEDRARLDGERGRHIRIVEKAGFNRNGFIAEVRRALLVNP